MREFLLGKVVEPRYDYDGGEDDFNRILHVQPLVPAPIPANSALVPEFLKHDLSKRVRYYEIYPERLLSALDQLVEKVSASSVNLSAEGRRARHSTMRERTPSANSPRLFGTHGRRNYSKSFAMAWCRACHALR